MKTGSHVQNIRLPGSEFNKSYLIYDGFFMYLKKKNNYEKTSV